MKRLLTAASILVLLSGIAYAQENPAPMETPPPPAAPRKVTVPKPVETTLPNGIRVICVSRPGSGLVTARLLLRSGAAGNGSTGGSYGDPANKAGLTNMVSDLLTKGTKTRSATQIADSIERLGASLGAGAGYDGTTVTLSVLKTRLPQAFPLFADVIQNPTFPTAEVERLRTQDLDDLQVAYRQPGTLARTAAARVLFGSQPYGAPVGGTPESLRAIRRADLITSHNANYYPQNSVLIFAGDIQPAQAFALAKAQFAKWNKKPVIPTQIVAAIMTSSNPEHQREIVVIDRPDAGQAAVLINRLGIARDDPNYVLATVTNDILGGGYSSRLNREVRIKRGLSYGASSRLDARRLTGPLIAAAQTKNESAGETARVIVDELARLGSDDIAADELAARKSALSGDFSRTLETTAGLASLVGNLAQYNRPFSELNTYLPKVQAVTAEQAKAFAAKSFSATDANVIIVGNASKFLDDLKTRFPGENVIVIPFADLDLNRGNLLKAGK